MIRLTADSLGFPPRSLSSLVSRLRIEYIYSRNYGEIAWLSSIACVWAGMATIAMCEVLRNDEPAIRFPESGGEHLYLCPNTGTGWHFSTAG
jgi:hypothetical protein